MSQISPPKKKKKKSRIRHCVELSTVENKITSRDFDRFYKTIYTTRKTVTRFCVLCVSCKRGTNGILRIYRFVANENSSFLPCLVRHTSRRTPPGKRSVETYASAAFTGLGTRARRKASRANFGRGTREITMDGGDA